MLTITVSIRSASVGIELVEAAAQLGERRRAHVRAVGVAEEHDEQAVLGGDEAERFAAAADVRHGGHVDHRLRITGEPDELAFAATARRQRRPAAMASTTADRRLTGHQRSSMEPPPRSRR